MKAPCEPTTKIWAIQENARGVQVLTQGDLPLALQSFSSAFHAAKQALEEDDRCSATRKGTHSIDCYISSDVPSRFLSQDAQQAPFIYRNGIFLPIQRHPHFSPYFVMSAIVFNLALANHLLGEQNPSSSGGREMLAQAAKLYELGYKLQETRPTGSPVYFMMASLNNMGHAHGLLGNEENANAIFSRLLSTLMLVLHQTTDKQEVCGGGNNHFKCLEEGFLQSTFYLILGHQSTTAPTA